MKDLLVLCCLKDESHRAGTKVLCFQWISAELSGGIEHPRSLRHHSLERWLAKGFRNTIRLNIISDIYIIEIKLQVLQSTRSCFVLKIKELKSKNCNPQDFRTNQLPHSRAI